MLPKYRHPCQLDKALTLLRAGVDPDSEVYPEMHPYGYSLLHLATLSREEHAETLLSALIEAGADMNRRSQKSDKVRTPPYTTYTSSVSGAYGN